MAIMGHDTVGEPWEIHAQILSAGIYSEQQNKLYVTRGFLRSKCFKILFNTIFFNYFTIN